MRQLQTFQCEICKEVYDAAADAQRCEAQGRDEQYLKVGDIVLARSGFGWFDGDENWVENYAAISDGGKYSDRQRLMQEHPDHGNCFSACCTFQFFYVVTAIDNWGTCKKTRTHQRRYHLFTEAMTVEQGYRSGVTFREGHHTPILAEYVPASVREAAAKLVGQTADCLL